MSVLGSAYAALTALIGFQSYTPATFALRAYSDGLASLYITAIIGLFACTLALLSSTVQFIQEARWNESSPGARPGTFDIGLSTIAAAMRAVRTAKGHGHERSSEVSTASRRAKTPCEVSVTIEHMVDVDRQRTLEIEMDRMKEGDMIDASTLRGDV